MNLTADQRVANGSLLLDATIPGWAERLDGWRLNVMHDRRCPLARACGRYGTYGAGLRQVFRPFDGPVAPADVHALAIRHGFHVDSIPGDNAALVAAWNRAVAQRVGSDSEQDALAAPAAAR